MTAKKSTTARKPDETAGRARDVDLVMRRDIALGLAQPRKLTDPQQQQR